MSTHPTNRTSMTAPISTMTNEADQLLLSQQSSLPIDSTSLCNNEWDALYYNHMRFVKEFYPELLLMISTMHNTDHLQDKDKTPNGKAQPSVELADKDPATTTNLAQEGPAFYPEFITSENSIVRTHPKNSTPMTDSISTATNNDDRLAQPTIIVKPCEVCHRILSTTPSDKTNNER